MTKIAKHNQILEDLRAMVQKTAGTEKDMNKEAEKPVATGVAGADTHYTGVSEKTEHTDKNKVGPEKNPQDFKQEPAKGPSIPVEHAKKAEEIPAATPPAATSTPAVPAGAGNKTAAELGKEILGEINKLAEKPVATGVAGADTHYTGVSEKTEHTDKNKVGPEKNPQDFKQEPAKGPSIPVEHAKKAEDLTQEELDKIASFEWGRQVAAEYLKQAEEQQLEVYKIAGRRDFETLIAQAAAELEQKEAASAEKQGADLFDQLFMQNRFAQPATTKVAAVTAPDNKYEELAAKIAEFDGIKADLIKQASDAKQALLVKEAELSAKLAQEKRAEEMSLMVRAITEQVTGNILQSLRETPSGR